MIDKLIPIKTERLLLDRFKKEDWEEFFMIEKSQEQHRFTAESFNPSTAELTKKYVEGLSAQSYDEQKSGLLFAIRRKETPKLIGFIGFQNGRLILDGQIEVYYSIYRDFWGNGFGTEALKAMIKFGFEDIKLHRILAYCDADNLASKKIMEKAGMKLEARMIKDRKRDGVWTDGLGFAIIEEDLG